MGVHAIVWQKQRGSIFCESFWVFPEHVKFQRMNLVDAVLQTREETLAWLSLGYLPFTKYFKGFLYKKENNKYENQIEILWKVHTLGVNFLYEKSRKERWIADRWLGTKNKMPQNLCSIRSKNANGLLN